MPTIHIDAEAKAILEATKERIIADGVARPTYSDAVRRLMKEASKSYMR